MFRVSSTTSILLFLFLLTGKPLSQQTELYFENFGMKEGLPNHTIYSIVQDSKGFLWMGTLDGLARYDGYKFKVYKHNPKNVHSLSDNLIWSIFCDSSGDLWIGTSNGLNKFDYQTEIFTRYLHDPFDSLSLSNNRVIGIYEDKNGTLWIGTEEGLNKFNRSTKEFIRYINDPLDSNDISANKIYYSLVEDNNNNLWIGTMGGGLNRLNLVTNIFTHYKNNPNDSTSLSDDRIWTMYLDDSETLWIGTDGGGLNKFVISEENINVPSFTRYYSNPENSKSISSNIINTIIKANSKSLWIGTDNGLNLFDKNSDEFITYKPDSLNPYSINSRWILSLLKDDSGLLWIGTSSGGLSKLDSKKMHFRQSLIGYDVGSFCEYDTNLIWIGTFGAGLCKFDRAENRFSFYTHNPSNPTSISSNFIFHVYKDKSDIIWIATDKGLDRLNQKEAYKNNPSFVHYYKNDPNKNDPSDSTSLGYIDGFEMHPQIRSIYEDDKGTVWIGIDGGGISLLQPIQKEKTNPSFSYYHHDSNDTTSLSSNRVFCIYGDKSNDIWIGTWDGGLNKFDNRSGNFIRYMHDENDINSLSHDFVISIYEDNAGTIWIGTASGLNKLDKESGKFEIFTTEDGLPNDFITGILEDNKGNLWISTNNGLSKFNPTTKEFKNFNQSDGLQSNEFNFSASLRISNGEMLFGGIKGFNLFHPERIKDNTYKPKIVITDFQLNNIQVPIGLDTTTKRTILERSIVNTREIELNHDDRVFSFEFSALDFHAPEKNKYAYMMEGFDEKWNYRDADNRFVTYTNLDPGEYTFRVKGSNNDGYWNEEGVSIRIIILPPWWATTWAYIIYALIILSVIYFTWKLQLKRLRIKHDYEMSKFEAEKMHEVDEMKSRFFTNISHEFRTPLTLIFGPAKDIMENCDDKKVRQSAGLIKRNASRLYGLVNQLLDLSKLESGKMKLEASEQNIMPLLKGLVLSFTSLAERKKITLKFNTIEENLKVYIDKDKVEKIITNLLSNAFKFTPEGGKIDFTVEKMIEEVEIRITDNGIGIPKERINKIFDRFFQVDGSHTRESEGTGIGLALTKELVELHKGKIKVESKEGKGTTLTVLLPLGKEHLKPDEIVEKETDAVAEVITEDAELIPEEENRKEKTDIDIFFETDKPLLLIVEDNSDVRQYIISHLDEDYRIQEAVDGEDGLEQAFNHIPDLIISDVMMPKMDGFELCDKLKTDERTSHIPIIMLTAKATSKDKIEGYETGADDYIMKPFDAKELKVRIKNLIEIRRKLQEKFSADDYSIPKDLSSIDEQFMKRVLQVLNEHISEEEFSVEELSNEAAMSSRHLQRKLIALTGKPPKLFIRSVRLRKAKKFIKENRSSISEIAYDLGFGSPAYFTKCFKEEFGYSPSELANK